jgi:hypothetical protein
MADQLKRTGLIIKIIANNPGIRLGELLHRLAEQGLKVSEKTLATDIERLKKNFRLLPDQPRLRSGYVLAGFTTIGNEELATVCNALSAFGANLQENTALEISERIGRSDRVMSILQRNIYKPAKTESDIDQKLSLAIKDHLAVKVVVDSPRIAQPIHITFFPLFRVFHERGWYVISRSVEKQEYWPTRQDRIISCEILKRTSFNKSFKEDLDTAHFLMNTGWGMNFPHTMVEYEEIEEQPEIVVRFDATVAAFIKEGVGRHPLAKMTPAPDGSGQLDFRLKLKYYDEFRNWVRSWGAKAWFVEPQSFIDRERAEIRRQMQNYGM